MHITSIGDGCREASSSRRCPICICTHACHCMHAYVQVPRGILESSTLAPTNKQRVKVPPQPTDDDDSAYTYTCTYTYPPMMMIVR